MDIGVYSSVVELLTRVAGALSFDFQSSHISGIFIVPVFICSFLLSLLQIQLPYEQANVISG